jgi:hypothetical protein
MPRFRKTALMSLVLSGCLLGGVVSLRADQRSDCDKRVRKAEENLHKEIRKHGERSRQAQSRRRDLDQVRQRCREFDNHRDRGRRRHHDRDRDYDRDRRR